MESMELPTDPDAQATVTDFLDFTEFLPSDMIRSLTLIGKLDGMYADASMKLHEDVKTYGMLPEMPVDKRPNDIALRATISQEVSETMSARYLASAEATRFGENVDIHVKRAENILAKLMKMRDEYPSEDSIVLDTPDLIRSKPAAPMRENGMRSGRKQKPPPRITVPGEVLAPYERDYDWYDSDDDSGSDGGGGRVTLGPRAASVAPGVKTIKLKIVNKDKKRQKTPQRKETVVRPPGPPVAGMGTNVHSRVAGISTSNALRLCQPPPPGSVIGDKNLPWLACNDWETATLRKNMKKNANWSPSDTMIARQLELAGRGYENYKIAAAKALAEGKPPLEVPPQLLGITVNTPGALSIEYLKQKDKAVNRGMKLNEAKKLKKESMAKQAAEEAASLTAAVHGTSNLGNVMANLFGGDKSKTLAVKAPAKPATASKKRKREDDTSESVKPTPGTPATAVPPPLKRNKTETPIPVPQNKFAKQASSLHRTASIASVASPAPTVTSTTDSTPEITAPRTSSTPVLPPRRDLKNTVKSNTSKPAEPLLTTRSKRSDDIVASPVPVPAPEPSTKRPTSSRSKKTSEEPINSNPITATAASDRPQRTSTARNTPAPPENHQSRSTRATRRPPPGVLSNTSDGEGSTAVSQRSKATQKKKGKKAEKKVGGDGGREGSTNLVEYMEEVDDEGNPIDPNEPRYCLCNRVSFGSMICCDNDAVSRSSFLRLWRGC